MKPSTTRLGFTLIELSIAIGVVAILAALLIPALRTAQGRGEASACLANLRSWGTAIAGYTAENGGLLPQNEYPKDSANPAKGDYTFFTALAPYGGYRYPITDPALFRRTMLACPAEKEFASTPFYHYALTVDLNYRINGSTPERNRTAVRLQNLQNANTYVLMSDSYETCVIYSYKKERLDTFTNIMRRHGGTPNFLYADGHVEPFREPLVGYGDPGGMTPEWRARWFANSIPPNQR